MQKRSEQPLLAAVRRRRHQQGARDVEREHLCGLMVRDRSRGEPVSLVEHNRVPAHPVRMDGVLDRGVDRQQVEADDPQVVAAVESVLPARSGR